VCKLEVCDGYYRDVCEIQVIAPISPSRDRTLTLPASALRLLITSRKSLNVGSSRALFALFLPAALRRQRHSPRPRHPSINLPVSFATIFAFLFSTLSFFTASSAIFAAYRLLPGVYFDHARGIPSP
jgi:membrane associated rhomboid family serine protease